MRPIKKSASGFTLVELAISLMIIGLLIGGVLRGEELLENARNTQFVRQLQAYSTAVKAFNLAYDAVPGDIPDPSTRIPDCTTNPCAVGGGGDNLLTPSTVSAPANDAPSVVAASCSAPTCEGRNFWVHLVKAQLITTTIDPTILPGTAFSGKLGAEIPKSPDGDIGVETVSYTTAQLGAGTSTPGNYYVLRPLANAYGMKGSRAFFIDSKMDDGLPNTGNVRVGTYSGVTTPIATCVASGVYVQGSKVLSCNLLVRIN